MVFFFQEILLFICWFCVLRGNQKEDKVCKELLKSVTKSIHILLTFSVRYVLSFFLYSVYYCISC